jgi:hypothetical protein
MFTYGVYHIDMNKVNDLSDIESIVGDNDEIKEHQD